MNNKENKKNIGTDSIKLTGSKLVTTVITMLSSMLLARFRSLTEYGTYSQLLMAVNLVCSFIMLGLPNSINYFLARAKNNEERGKFLSVYYTLNTVLSLIAGGVLVAGIPVMEQIFSNPYIKSFWYFLALYPWTRIIMSSVENLLIVYKKTGLLILYRVSNSVVLLAIIFLIQLFKGTFMMYMFFYLSVEIIFTIFTYILAKTNATALKVSLDRATIKTILKFSIPIGIASMIGTINIELDKFVITSFFTTEELAIYTIASKELPVTIIASSLTAVLLPQMVRFLQIGKTKEAVDLWKCATTISFAIICFISIVCVVFAPEVISILYSDKYLDGITVFRIYSVALMLKCTYYGMMLNASGKTKFILYSSIGTLVLNIVLNYVLFFIFGFIGPALATLLAAIIMQLVQLAYTCKVCNIKMADVFPWKNTGLLLMLNIISGCAIYAIHCSLIRRINGIISALVLGIIWTAIIVAILYKPLMKQWRILNS